MEWGSLWREIQSGLLALPRCPEHPEYPVIHTLVMYKVPNDILDVNDVEITVRSHRKNRSDVIREATFRNWWSHLQTNSEASLQPGAPDNPPGPRSYIVGAILVTVLPKRIHAVTTNRIRLTDS